jgi:NAD(P)-dependent dehydrogenase (short-subunit alcohol dehydrogenase family)
MSVVDFSLAGKVAIVTGGSKGIGRAIALAFAEHGADVVIAARGAEALERTKEEIAATGPRALAVQADVAEDADLEKLYQRTCKEFGGVDVLVNNAATVSLGTLAQETGAEFLRIMKVNVWAPLYLARLCRESMAKRGGGAIINITSNEGVRPSTGIGTYALSKAALINMAQLLGKEWARDGIRVSCIAPGLIRTELAQSLVEAVEAGGLQINAQARIGEPHEIAGMALLLASPAGAFATGMTYVIDGGEVSAGPGDMVVWAAKKSVEKA